MSAGGALWAYAVVPERTRLAEPLRGLADAPVQLLGDGSHALLVSVLASDAMASAEDPQVLAAHAERHHEVVRSMLDSAPAVLPFRLGTVLRDRAAVRAYLEGRRESLQRALRHLEDRREWSVLVDASGDGPRGETSGSPPPCEGLGAGAAYLAQRRHQLTTAEMQRRERAALLHDVGLALRERVVDVAVGHERDDAVAFAEHYLVERAREPEFFETVDACGDALLERGLTLRLTGPWPAYSFARISMVEQAHD